MKKLKKSELEKQIGKCFQTFIPEKLISRKIGKRIDNYILEFDVYTAQLQEESNYYKQKFKELTK